MLVLERTSQVWAITGNLGGGKSLTAVSLAVSSMARGYFVCSNITLDVGAIGRVYGKRAASLYLHIDLDAPDFDPFKLPCGSPRGSGGGKRVLVILDECAEWVDQYSSAKDPRIARLWSWLRHSSKRSQDVILVVQRMDYLNKVLRLLIARWVIVDDLNTWRMPVIKLRLPFCGGLVMQRVFDRSGRIISGPHYIQKSVWGSFYDTAECLNKDGAEYSLQYSGGVILPPFPFKSFMLWLGCFITLLYYIFARHHSDEPRRRVADAPCADCHPPSLGYMCPYPHKGGISLC